MYQVSGQSLRSGFASAKGHIDWPATFHALRSSGYDGWLTIEAFGSAMPDLAVATRVWRDFFPSREEVYTEGLKFIKQQWNAAANNKI